MSEQAIDAVLFGHPVKHSRSPEMFHALAQAGGPLVRYGLMDVEPEGLSEAIQSLRDGKWDAAGITIPHKRALFSMVDSVQGIAEVAGTINTISRHADGRLVATNTDGPGFLRALRDFTPELSIVGQPVVILGTGGAACGAAASLQQVGARITMVSRTPQKQHALIPRLCERVIGWEDPDLVPTVHQACLIVQATPIGMAPEIDAMVPLPAEAFLTHHRVVDMIYTPWETRFLATARERGARALNGWPMLVYQAMYSLEFWLGPNAGRQLPQAVRQIERRDPTCSARTRHWTGMGLDSPRLSNLRASLREVDEKLLDLLSHRMRLVEPIADEKSINNLPIRDRSQESRVLKWAEQAARERDLAPQHALSLFQVIMDMSCSHQAEHIQRGGGRALHVAYRGTDGSLSHIAAERRFHDRMHRARFQGLSSFRDVFQAVKGGLCDVGIVPLQTVVIGGVRQVCRLLVEEGLVINGEERLSLELCLLGREGAQLTDITVVHAPASLLRQCGRFLERTPWIQPRVVVHDSAAAAQALLEFGDSTMGVIAGRSAAERFGLKVLQRNIQDSNEHSTRFIEIARAPSWLPTEHPRKSTLNLTLPQENRTPLHEMLQGCDVTVTWMHPLPRRHPAHPRHVLLDIMGSPEDEPVIEAIALLQRRGITTQVLGTYPCPA